VTRITPKETDDRIVDLARDGGASSRPQESGGLDVLPRLLSDPAVWEQPAAGLEDSIVAAIREESRADKRRVRSADAPDRAR
jgi:hypothetical protein